MTVPGPDVELETFLRSEHPKHCDARDFTLTVIDRPVHPLIARTLFAGFAMAVLYLPAAGRISPEEDTSRGRLNL